MNYIYIVIDTELGWDNIVVCFTSREVANECANDRNSDIGDDSSMVIEQVLEVENSGWE
jgi:hypothetical protein